MNLRNVAPLLINAMCLAALGLPRWGAAEEWMEYKKAPHCIVYYKHASDATVERFTWEAEEQFQIITDWFGFRPYPEWRGDDRVKMYLYDDKEEYQHANREVKHSQWSAGMADPAAHAIRTYPQATEWFFDDLLPHELGHLLLYHFVGWRADIPQWFSEVVAELQEQAEHRIVSEVVKKQIEKDGYIALSELQIDNKETFENYYPCAASATQYLVSRLPGNKLRTLLELLRDGMSFSAALNDVSNGYLKDIQDLNDQWVAYVKHTASELPPAPNPSTSRSSP